MCYFAHFEAPRAAEHSGADSVISWCSGIASQDSLSLDGITSGRLHVPADMVRVSRLQTLQGEKRFMTSGMGTE